MPAALYQTTFSSRSAYRRPQARLSRAPEDLEFSEYGRSPAVPPGWYLAPVLLAVPVLLYCLLA